LPASHNGWQHAAYWDDACQVSIARRLAVSQNTCQFGAPVCQTGVSTAFLRTAQELIMNDRAPREIGRPRRIALQKVLCGLPISAVQNVHPALKTPSLRSPKVPSLRVSGHDWAARKVSGAIFFFSTYNNDSLDLCWRTLRTVAIAGKSMPASAVPIDRER
jgi:hypothetical protein